MSPTTKVAFIIALLGIGVVTWLGRYSATAEGDSKVVVVDHWTGKVYSCWGGMNLRFGVLAQGSCIQSYPQLWD